jgi:hypothetical protein
MSRRRGPDRRTVLERVLPDTLGGKPFSGFPSNGSFAPCHPSLEHLVNAFLRSGLIFETGRPIGVTRSFNYKKSIRRSGYFRKISLGSN